MGIFFLIIAGVGIYLFVSISNKEKAKRREWEYQEELIRRGVKKRCRDGVIRLKAEAEAWEKTHHSDYHYLKNQKGYIESRLNSMTLTEIIHTAKPYHEEDERKRLAEIQRKEVELQYWKDPMRHFVYKITGSNSKTSGVYMIRNDRNEKFYIGSSMDIQKRISNHLYNLRSNNHHSYKMQNDFNDFGENAFSFYVLQEIDLDEDFARRLYEKHEVTDKRKKARLEYYEQSHINRFEPFYNVFKDVDQWKKTNYSNYYG